MNKDFILYVDMDGVLTDFDSQFKKRTGISKAQAVKNGTYEIWMLNLVETSFFKDLPPSKTFQNGLYSLIKTASSMIDVQILTSYGPWYNPQNKLGDQFGVKTHKNKVEWLNNWGLKYLISEFNGVPLCTDKHRYGNSNTFLIDDQPANVEGFIKNGGEGIVYLDTPANYDDTAAKFENWLRSKNII